MKAKPGQITVATAGVTSAGHNAMELIAKATGVNYKDVTYDGGNPAVVATVAGEAEVTTQLAVEQADMIRGKRLRPLATVSDKPLELEGYGTIPPLSATLPGFTAPANYFGIFIPKGVPDEVVKTLEKIWAEQIAKSEALKKYADQPRRAVRAAVRRSGAEGRVPGGAGQRLDCIQQRQDQGLARHRRHPQALTDTGAADDRGDARDVADADVEARADPHVDGRAATARPAWLDGARRRRADRLRSRMDRLEAQNINPYTVPGPAAGPARHRHDRARRLVLGAAQLAPRRRSSAPRRRAVPAAVAKRARRSSSACASSTPSAWSATACRSGSPRRSTSTVVDPGPAGAAARDRRPRR